MVCNVMLTLYNMYLIQVKAITYEQSYTYQASVNDEWLYVICTNNEIRVTTQRVRMV